MQAAGRAVVAEEIIATAIVLSEGGRVGSNSKLDRIA